MRVTQRTMYDTMLGNMHNTLSAYMESNIQGGSQKKINRPSDDPAGMALVLNSRRNISSTEQYQRNVDTAKGWLGLADSTMMQVETTIIKIKELANQAATETMTDENRDQVASQLRQLFGQILNLSNTQFENKNIFAGHKYEAPAFGEVLGVRTHDPKLQDKNFVVTGKSDSSIKLEFESTGVVGEKASGALNYRWTEDGGKNWKTGSMAAGENEVVMGGVKMTIPNGSQVTARDPNLGSTNTNGSVFFFYPTAKYMGDENGANTYASMTGAPAGSKVSVTGDVPDNVLFEMTNSPDLRAAGTAVNYRYSLDGGANWKTATANVPDPADGTVKLPFDDGATPPVTSGTVNFDLSTAPTSILPNTTKVTVQPRRTDIIGGAGMMANTQGSFNDNTLIRVDGDVDLSVPNSTVNYSYSLDGGKNWIKATSQTPADAATNPSVRLPLPGGYMTVKPEDAAGKTLLKGTQFMVHPDRANLNYEIMQDTYLPVNSVGKDVFGGIYNGQVVGNRDSNLFETVGELIAYAENNDSDGVSKSLERLTKSLTKITTENARFGGMENRLALATDVLSFEKLDQQQRLSYTEDIDLTTLLTNLAKQEMAYNTVLKSSSMIMQLNLTKFL